jgi:hypothetical protein
MGILLLLHISTFSNDICLKKPLPAFKNSRILQILLKKFCEF